MKKKILVVAGLLAMSGALTAQSVLSWPTCRKVEERNRGSDESQEF